MINIYYTIIIICLLYVNTSYTSRVKPFISCGDVDAINLNRVSSIYKKKLGRVKWGIGFQVGKEYSLYWVYNTKEEQDKCYELVIKEINIEKLNNKESE